MPAIRPFRPSAYLFREDFPDEKPLPPPGENNWTPSELGAMEEEAIQQRGPGGPFNPPQAGPGTGRLGDPEYEGQKKDFEGNRFIARKRPLTDPERYALLPAGVPKDQIPETRLVWSPPRPIPQGKTIVIPIPDKEGNVFLTEFGVNPDGSRGEQIGEPIQTKYAKPPKAPLVPSPGLLKGDDFRLDPNQPAQSPGEGKEWKWVGSSYTVGQYDAEGNLVSERNRDGWVAVKSPAPAEIRIQTPTGLDIHRLDPKTGQYVKKQTILVEKDKEGTKTITVDSNVYRINEDGTRTLIQTLPPSPEATQTALDKFNAAQLAKATQERLGLTAQAKAKAEETESAFNLLKEQQRGRFGTLFEALNRGTVTTANPLAPVPPDAVKQMFRLQDLPGGQVALAQSLNRAGQVVPGQMPASVIVPGIGNISATVNDWEGGGLGPRPADAGNQTPYQYYASRGYQTIIHPFSEQRINELTPAFSQVKALTQGFEGSYRPATSKELEANPSEGMVFVPDVGRFGVTRQEVAGQKLGQMFYQGQAMSDPLSAARIRRSWEGREAAQRRELTPGGPLPASLVARDTEIARIEREQFEDEERRRRAAESEAARPFRAAAQQRRPFWQR